jgi:hypothetical protein
LTPSPITATTSPAPGITSVACVRGPCGQDHFVGRRLTQLDIRHQSSSAPVRIRGWPAGSIPIRRANLGRQAVIAVISPSECRSRQRSIAPVPGAADPSSPPGPGRSGRVQPPRWCKHPRGGRWRRASAGPRPRAYSSFASGSPWLSPAERSVFASTCKRLLAAALTAPLTSQLLAPAMDGRHAFAAGHRTAAHYCAAGRPPAGHHQPALGARARIAASVDRPGRSRSVVVDGGSAGALHSEAAVSSSSDLAPAFNGRWLNRPWVRNRRRSR